MKFDCMVNIFTRITKLLHYWHSVVYSGGNSAADLSVSHQHTSSWNPCAENFLIPRCSVHNAVYRWMPISIWNLWAHIGSVFWINDLFFIFLGSWFLCGDEVGIYKLG